MIGPHRRFSCFSPSFPTSRKEPRFKVFCYDSDGTLSLLDRGSAWSFPPYFFFSAADAVPVRGHDQANSLAGVSVSDSSVFGSPCELFSVNLLEVCGDHRFRPITDCPPPPSMSSLDL